MLTSILKLKLYNICSSRYITLNNNNNNINIPNPIINNFLTSRINLYNNEKNKVNNNDNDNNNINNNSNLNDQIKINAIKLDEFKSSISKEFIINKNDNITSILSSNYFPKNNYIGILLNNQISDINTKLLNNSNIELIDSNSNNGIQLLWHSAAHILGQAIERIYPNALLRDGPALKYDSMVGGFYYDVLLNTTIKDEDLKIIEDMCMKILNEKQDFEKITVSIEFAKQLFAYNPFKLAILEKCTDDVTLYKCGSLIDLCRGPHIPNTNKIKVLELLRVGAVQHVESDKTYSMQRIYGIAFDDKKKLKEWKTRKEEAEKRDHRAIIASQKLVLFHKWSPGSAFFLPHGVRMYNRLLSLIRSKYLQYNYSEVISPLIFSHELWKQSGHWEHYSDDMFVVTDANTLRTPAKLSKLQGMLSKENPNSNSNIVEVENQEDVEVMCLKPMNCPGHCLIFSSSIRSYRDLPIRFADFSSLHRNEASGALSGLTRVRRFEQDDAHIFCMPSHIQTEIRNCLEFVYSVYSKLFGMSFVIRLSTRPEGFLGSISEWDHAEAALKDSLHKFETFMHQQGKEFKWEINVGDGAFYGPKLDIAVTDALGRQHQCATVQLDFQLPRRFNLKYTDKDSTFQTPVMIHRAILGSFQRIIAILTEHTAGRWPFWINPRQVMVCPVSEVHLEYAQSIQKVLHDAGFYADVASDNSTLNKRIREAQVEQYNYILVVGEKEIETKTISIRSRDNGDVKTSNLIDFIMDIQKLSLSNLPL